MGSNVFNSASVDSGILILTNVKEKNYIIKCAGKDFKYNEIENSYFLGFNNLIFNIYSNDLEYNLANKILSNKTILSDIVDFARGMEFGFNSDITTDKRLNDNYKLIVCGGNIHRYFITSYNKYVEFDSNNPNIYKTEKIYFNEKILLRRIGNKLVCAFDDSGLYNVCDVYNLTIKSHPLISLKFIASLINSKLINFYYNIKFKSAKLLFPKIPIQNLKLLPIKLTTSDLENIFIDLYNHIHKLNSENMNLVNKFIAESKVISTYKISQVS
ncbi:MAG: hypothetical protein IPO92_18965 [Saprospiraceae bacterium]|nr:hypothetical protein [Saprospiraceae bacterium]